MPTHAETEQDLRGSSSPLALVASALGGVLTEFLPWRSAGLFGLVFGFSHAESAGSISVVTRTSLIPGVALLVAFGFAEARVVAPLLPLRVVSDRPRAAAFGALAVSGFAMSGLFLFPTYYLHTVRGVSPLTSGLAFLPMIGCIVLSADLANTVTMPRFRPRVVITTGMIIVGGLALAYLSLLDVNSSYIAGILPSLTGTGMIVAFFFGRAYCGGADRRRWPGAGSNRRPTAFQAVARTN